MTATSLHETHLSKMSNLLAPILQITAILWLQLSIVFENKLKPACLESHWNLCGACFFILLAKAGAGQIWFIILTDKFSPNYHVFLFIPSALTVNMEALMGEDFISLAYGLIKVEQIQAPAALSNEHL